MTKSSIFRASTALAALVAASPALALDPAAPAAAAQQADPAAAPADGEALGDILVTARRRSETLQSVPIAITAVSADRIEREGVQNVADIARLTPSVIFDKGFSPQDNRVMIRGLPGVRGRPPVAILIDGIDTTTESIATAGGGNLMDLRLVDFARIEVVKGPQSALYGRSAFGGAINYITREPGDTLGGYVSAEAGLYGRYEARGAIDLPASDTLSFRINGVYTRFDGFYRNTVTGNKLGGFEAFGGSLSARWEPTSDFKVVGRVSYADDQEEQQATKYYGANYGRTTPIALPASAAGRVVGGATLPASVLSYRRGFIQNENVPISLSADPADPTGKTDYPGAHTYNVIASLRAEWDLGGPTLSSWTGYIHSTGSTVQDVDYFGRSLTQAALPSPGGLGEFSGAVLGNGFWQFDIHTKIEQVSQELRLSDQDGGPFRWAIGGLFWHEDVGQVDRRFLSYGLGAAASTSLNVALQGGRSTVSAYQARTTRHLSGYAMAEFDIVPTVTVSAEGRYAHEALDYIFGQTVGIRSGVNLTTGPAGFVLTGTNSAAESSTNYFTPRGIISWKPTGDLLFYASAARGIKPGGFTQVGAADPNLGKFKAERLSNYELGAKTSLFDRRLRLNAAYFHIDYVDKQSATLIAVPTSVAAQGSLSVTTNAGGAKIDGQEFDYSLLIAPGLVLAGSYTHLAPRYTDYVYNSTTALTIARAGNCTIVATGTATTCQITETGQDLENAPRHSAQTSLTYTREIGNGVKGFIEASGQYRGKRNLEDSGSYKLRDYTLFDLRFGIETAAFSITAYVDNVFDDRTIKSAVNLIDVPAGVLGQLDIVAYVPDPRTAGLRLKANF